MILKNKEQINLNKNEKNDKLKQLNKFPIKNIKKEIPKYKNIKKIEKDFSFSLYSVEQVHKIAVLDLRI